MDHLFLSENCYELSKADSCGGSLGIGTSFVPLPDNCLVSSVGSCELVEDGKPLGQCSVEVDSVVGIHGIFQTELDDNQVAEWSRGCRSLSTVVTSSLASRSFSS